MLFRAITVLVAAAWVLPAAAARPCGADLRGAQMIEAANAVVAYRTQPAKIPVGKHFSIDIVTCAKGNAPVPSVIAVDAFMPEHGHGMNYKAAVRATGSAHFRADGLMFHMPGRWDLVFDVQGPTGAERLTRSIVVE
jgi:hypothetical protein